MIENLDSGFAKSLDTSEGENYAFTPPYYYGSAFADIVFEPSETKKYSPREIFEEITISYTRYADFENPAEISKTRMIEADSMALNASLNILSQVKVNNEGAVVDSLEGPSRWAIQTKFETPMLNFNHLSASDSITLPTNGSQSVARGMWHQYGRIERDPQKGIFLSVKDIPEDYLEHTTLGITHPRNYTFARRTSPEPGLYFGVAKPKKLKSLVDLVGFDTTEKRLGEVAPSKVISEAVVCLPFVEVDGERKFFEDQVLKEMIQAMASSFMSAAGTIETSGGSSWTENFSLGEVNRFLAIAEAFKDYVFPPTFKMTPSDPIYKMLIFEFHHTLDQTDLSDIWQNLPPKLSRKFEHQSVTIKDTLDFEGYPQDKIKWMIFKVKKRANINYYTKVVGETSRGVEEGNNTMLGAGVDLGAGGFYGDELIAGSAGAAGESPGFIAGTSDAASYNWPYDFFSMVELVNLEVEAKMKNPAYSEPLQAGPWQRNATDLTRHPNSMPRDMVNAQVQGVLESNQESEPNYGPQANSYGPQRSAEEIRAEAETRIAAALAGIGSEYYLT
jgi:hypothetical protein